MTNPDQINVKQYVEELLFWLTAARHDLLQSLSIVNSSIVAVVGTQTLSIRYERSFASSTDAGYRLDISFIKQPEVLETIGFDKNNVDFKKVKQLVIHESGTSGEVLERLGQTGQSILTPYHIAEYKSGTVRGHWMTAENCFNFGGREACSIDVTESPKGVHVQTIGRTFEWKMSPFITDQLAQYAYVIPSLDLNETDKLPLVFQIVLIILAFTECHEAILMKGCSDFVNVISTNHNAFFQTANSIVKSESCSWF